MLSTAISNLRARLDAAFVRPVRRLLILGAVGFAAQSVIAAPIDDLCSAISNDNAAAVQSAISAGADINSPGCSSEPSLSSKPPLHEAAYSGSVNAARVLIDNGANVNARHDSETPLFETMHSGSGAKHRGVAELLIVRGADVHAKDKYGATPLHRAALNATEGVAEALLINGARVGEKDNDGAEPLHHAAVANAIAVARLLLAYGANINARAQGKTPLDIAREENATEVAALLIARTNSGGGGGGGGSGGGGSSNLPLALGAAALIGLGIYALSPSGEGEGFSFRPWTAYDRRGGAEDWRYGMRLDYRRDEWSLWWLSDGSRRGWGGEWRGEWLRAHGDVWESDDGAPLVGAGMSLSREWRGWPLRLSLRTRGDLGEDSSWRSGADLELEQIWGGWKFNPSLAAKDLQDPKTARLRLRAERSF